MGCADAKRVSMIAWTSQGLFAAEGAQRHVGNQFEAFHYIHGGLDLTTMSMPEQPPDSTFRAVVSPSTDSKELASGWIRSYG